jgi:hypothetical protein
MKTYPAIYKYHIENRALDLNIRYLYQNFFTNILFEPDFHAVRP